MNYLKNIIIGLMIGWGFLSHCQGQYFNYQCDDIQIGQATVNTGTYVYQTPATIEASHTGNQVSILQDAEVQYVASKYIKLRHSFLAEPGNAGYFDARILNESLIEEIVVEIPGPGQLATTSVGLYEKLQLGIKLDAAINSQVAAYRTNRLNNITPTTGLNPYDPDDISLEAVFTSPTGNVIRQYGFYYQKYSRNGSGATFTWQSLPNDYPWMVRFAPNEVGSWKVRFELYLYGQLQSQTLCESFSVIQSTNPGFITLGPNNRFFTYSGKDETYLGVGENLFETSICMNFTPEKMYRAERYLDELALGQGNLVRTASSNWNFGFEWEHLGFYEGGNNQNYCSYSNCPDAQIRAFEMDNFIDYCKAKDIYILLTHFHQYAHFEDGCDNNPSDGWVNNPYQDLSTVSEPLDFFQEPQARDQYKKNLRYLVARWGWSPQLVAHQISSEVDNALGLNDRTPTNVSIKLDALKSWHDDMAQYLHQIDGNHLVLGGFGSKSWANSVYSSTSNLDIGSYNFYGPGRRDDKELAANARTNINAWNLPLCITESGGEFSGNSVSDVCTDVTFHNTLWTSIFSGLLTNAMNFWSEIAIHGEDPFDPGFSQRNYSLHYRAVRAFWAGVTLHHGIFHKVGAAGNNSSYRKLSFPTNPGYRYEGFGLIQDDNSEGYIFTYNNSNWWGNLLSDNECLYTVWSDSFAINPGFRDNDINITEPENTSNTIWLHVADLTPYETYQIEFWETYGTGGILQTTSGFTDASGTLKIMIPYFTSGVNDERFDVAIKIFKNPGSLKNQPEREKEPSSQLTASIFPNPSQGTFTVSPTSTGKWDYVVKDCLGQEILAENRISGPIKLDLSKYPPGVYLITLNQNGLAQVYKLVKQ